MTHLRGIKPPAQRDSNALKKAPPAPKHLSAYARAEWKRILPGLIERGIIIKGDLGGIEELCIMRGHVREIEAALQADPLDKVLFGMLNRAAQTARQLSAEYGLTPTSRARVGAGTGNDDDDDSPNPLNIGRNRRNG
ncbi:P27 family phage terminase small subunit [Martelella mediterranea]|uniref:P27 family phage terminase small subunit n=1 Tax=Martelella mediterranea TaxID=293089 RepID=UPI001E441172|nr:P27 family phage terminase small subunit [Martelella mediterranea]MCD1634543.1 P27 family phage terminase small subunit [Martelella mediterranea]